MVFMTMTTWHPGVITTTPRTWFTPVCNFDFECGSFNARLKLIHNLSKSTPIMKRALLIAGLLLAAGGVLRAADAKENWTKHCAKCHGEDGKGQTRMGRQSGAKDYTDAKVQEALKDDKAFKII